MVLGKSVVRKFRLKDVECSCVVVVVLLIEQSSSLDCEDGVEKQETVGIDANSTKKSLRRTLIL